MALSRGVVVVVYDRRREEVDDAGRVEVDLEEAYAEVVSFLLGWVVYDHQVSTLETGKAIERGLQRWVVCFGDSSWLAWQFD